MSENPLPITLLNDYIFCPASIYFHSLDADTDDLALQSHYQINGTAAHTTIDSSEYSTRKTILQGMTVYSERYNLIGKIDVFDTATGVLTERKKKIINIYDGYVFQLYGQYFGLTEMGYRVNKIRLHSLDDNKTYDVSLPHNDSDMLAKFEETIDAINRFDLEDFVQDNSLKCNRCIYELLCSYSKKEER